MRRMAACSVAKMIARNGKPIMANSTADVPSWERRNLIGGFSRARRRLRRLQPSMVGRKSNFRVPRSIIHVARGQFNKWAFLNGYAQLEISGESRHRLRSQGAESGSFPEPRPQADGAT